MKAALLPEEENEQLQSAEVVTNVDKRVVTKRSKLRKASLERKATRGDKSIASGKLPTECRLRDETAIDIEVEAQIEREDQLTKREDQFVGEDGDDKEIDLAAKELKRSTLSGNVEAAPEKVLDLEKLNQDDVEVRESVKESKSSTSADEIVIDTEKLDEVVKSIFIDVLLEDTIPNQPGSSKSLGNKVLQEEQMLKMMKKWSQSLLAKKDHCSSMCRKVRRI